MDAHFSKILNPVGGEVPSITFIAAPAFTGKKDGFKFQKGSRGLGYYYDRIQINEQKERAEAEEEAAKVCYISSLNIIFIFPFNTQILYA